MSRTQSGQAPVDTRRRRVRWGMVLVWFLRILAMLWIAKGLMSWALLLGGGFEGRTTAFQTTVIYFALIDIIAGVGLWLTSTWGGVLWILAVMSHIILGAFFPRVVVLGTPAMMAQLALVFAYLTVSWLASREET